MRGGPGGPMRQSATSKRPLWTTGGADEGLAGGIRDATGAGRRSARRRTHHRPAKAAIAGLTRALAVDYGPRHPGERRRARVHRHRAIPGLLAWPAAGGQQHGSKTRCARCTARQGRAPRRGRCRRRLPALGGRHLRQRRRPARRRRTAAAPSSALILKKPEPAWPQSTSRGSHRTM